MERLGCSKERELFDDVFVREPTFDLAKAEVLRLVVREEREASIVFLEEWFLAEAERRLVLFLFSSIVWATEESMFDRGAKGFFVEALCSG